MQAYAVIGAGFGDEGKGATVDALVARLSSEGTRPLVARVASGAQAAHTVEAEGRRHVFGHVGSGALAGAPTWLGPGFVHNPPPFLRERDELAGKGAEVRVLADPAGRVTLPVDMALNQALEAARGDARHGSCGIGFGEVVGRSAHEDLRVDLRAVADAMKSEEAKAAFLARVERISALWARARIAEAGLDGAAERVLRAATPEVVEAWAADAFAHVAAIELADAGEVAAQGFGVVVFEGAQGLLLDRDAPFFPHVTRSRTGSGPMVDAALAMGVSRLESVYVTRAYATRHGAGPLPGEGIAPLGFVDETNGPNAFQGSLRFAPLCTSLVGGAIAHDLARARARIEVIPRLAVTCLDQTDGMALTMRDAGIEAIPASDLGAAFGLGDGWDAPLLAHGPAREDRAFAAPAPAKLAA